MPDLNNTGEAVNPNAGVLDTLYALGRYLTVIFTSVPILLALLGSKDLLGIVNYFRGADGTSLIAAAVGFGTLAWGLFKTFRRGKLAAKVALSRRVPDDIAKPKG